DRHPLQLVALLHAERHQKNLFRGQAVSRLNPNHFVHVALRNYNELEPGTEITECVDGLGIQALFSSDIRMPQFEGNVPLVDGNCWGRNDARGLDLYAVPSGLERLDQSHKRPVLQRLTAGHDDVFDPRLRRRRENLIQRRFRPASTIISYHTNFTRRSSLATAR